ncbi:MAG: type II toxin-antitoxin system RelE/ParE family toxin [Bacteroidetes bacterium]|nr:type II toxin-antitoxin system RelE/ParE family toxin [Fibrella sp.]
MTLSWNDEARGEMLDIYSHLFDLSPTLAEAWADELEKKQALLETFPEIGRLVPDYNTSFIREVFVKRYRLIYTYENELLLL